MLQGYRKAGRGALHWLRLLTFAPTRGRGGWTIEVRRFPPAAVGRAVRHQRNTKKEWNLYARTAERAFFGCFGFFGSLRCLSRLPIGVSFHVVKSFGALGTLDSSDCYLAPRISRIWPDMLMPNVRAHARARKIVDRSVLLLARRGGARG